MGTVPGLDRALKLYDSDKIGERTQGSKSLHEIFSNRENLELFQERARVNNGAGWVSLFQVLFTVVLTEKKLVPKKTGGPAGMSLTYMAYLLTASGEATRGRRVACAVRCRTLGASPLPETVHDAVHAHDNTARWRPADL